VARLGVGITYSSAIEELLHEAPELFDVLELEPQTFWTCRLDGPQRFSLPRDMLEHLSRLPGRKLIHSVGTPVGGTVAPDPEQLGLLGEMVDVFGCPWVSDHLSYNQTPGFATGFFLPPRQTPAGVRAVISSIRVLQDAVGVPVAVETGVNYLRPRPDELPDGAFVAEVVDTSGCGLLLDMHNVFTNAVNGRQPVDEFLDAIPLDRVWELHLAGGMEFDGFWLDAHSGAIPDALFAVCESLVPRLPHLAAIVFEIFPSFVPLAGLDVVRAQVERLRALWDLRVPAPPAPGPASIVPRARTAGGMDAVAPQVWEDALGALVIGHPHRGPAVEGLADDPGVRLMASLVREFRASMIVGVLRLTSRLLMLALGSGAFRVILDDFWKATPPQMYASLEAEAFAAYLEALDLGVPHLVEVLRFERATAATLTDGQPRVVEFGCEPLPLLRALAVGRLPEKPPRGGWFEIELTPDVVADATGLDPGEIERPFPYH
jgi:uncharacterized protein (UPF0276 family)